LGKTPAIERGALTDLTRTMKMTRLLLVSAAVVFTAFTAGPAAAAFDVFHHDGSRNDVRAWCTAEGGVISDREDYTMCISTVVPGTTLTCDDDGYCTTTGFDLTATGSVIRLPGADVAPAIQSKPAIMIPSGKTFRHLPYTGFGGLDIVE
jgi:hypothetical protein